MRPDRTQRVLAIVVAVLLVSGTSYLSITLGVVPLIIVGGAGVPAYFVWWAAYLRKPTEPSIILPPFLATATGFEFHVIEEYLGHYAPAISRIFNIGWSERAFVVISFVLVGALAAVSIGLYYRKALAGFVAILFLMTRLAECGLFIFPLLRPAIDPGEPGPVSRAVSGVFVADMPNYYFASTGHYYFPGMYSVALPIIPAIYALYRVWTARHPSR